MEIQTELEGGFVFGEEMTNKVAHLQNEIDLLKMRMVKAKAQQESLDPCDKESQLFSTSSAVDAEKLSALAKARTNAFLNYNTLHEVIKGSQAVKALKAGLELIEEKECAGDSAELRLEPEERDYVVELVEEEKELSKNLSDKSKTCLQQEVDIIQMRKEHADNLCRISDLFSKMSEANRKTEKGDSALLGILKHEEAKCNQIRLVIQRLMIGEKEMAQIFDKETNEKMKDMFYKCGLSPEELRKQKEQSNLAPQAS